ncbi:MAG: dienelactone hydrolase family protein [Caulobacter sp.]|nr:dienelactone hydrolase family protein [Caulobacter sp.]
MGERVLLTTKTGERLAAYHAPAQEARRGGLVILHAIWGVTPHIRELSDTLAAQGYEVIAPSLLDGEAPFPEHNTDFPILQQRMALGEAAGWGEGCTGQIQAAVDALAGPVFVMGFCFGGTSAWIASCFCDGITAVSCFYGGHIIQYVDETPKTPTILHFGKTDDTIPPAEVEAIAAAHPDLPLWLYDAGHAFVAPSGYHADSARLAMLRTLQLFHRSGGARGEV